MSKIPIDDQRQLHSLRNRYLRQLIKMTKNKRHTGHAYGVTVALVPVFDSLMNLAEELLAQNDKN